MVGDLDKAIWQIDYLIRQNRAMLIWHLIPLLVFIILVLGWGNGSLWAARCLALVVIPLAYFGGRWEVNKFYLPKSAVWESLRATLEAETM